MSPAYNIFLEPEFSSQGGKETKFWPKQRGCQNFSRPISFPESRSVAPGSLAAAAIKNEGTEGGKIA